MTNAVLALDRSERWKDQDGHLHVRLTNISKATINPYRGSEIPGWQALGLDSDRLYQLLRDPAELARDEEVTLKNGTRARVGLSTFNNLRLLSKHVAVSAADPKEELVAGSTGTDATFAHPYLTNSLVVWRAEDIAAVEARDKCQLSCAYYYEPDMTPGVWEGKAYDGVMRNLRGNHVALVEAGRAGPDVMVHDGKEPDMTEKNDKPEAEDGEEDVEAMDAAEATEENEARAKEREAKMNAEDRKAARDARRAARDAKRASDKKAMDAKTAKDAKRAADKAAKDKKAADAKAAKDRAARDRWKAADTDLSFEDWAKEETEEPEHEEPEAEDGKAMDAAIATAVSTAVAAAEKRVGERMRALAQAREDVRPIIGNVPLALDSAAGVYKLALDHLKVDTTDVPPAAYAAVLKAIPKSAPTRPALALDHAASAALDQMFPTLGRIGAA